MFGRGQNRGENLGVYRIPAKKSLQCQSCVAKIPARFLQFSVTRHRQNLTVLSLIEDWQSHSSFLVPLRSASHQNVLIIGRCSHLKFSGQPDTPSPSGSPSQKLLPMPLVNVNSTPSAHTFFSCTQLVSVCCPGSTDTHFTSCLAQAQNEALRIVRRPKQFTPFRAMSYVTPLMKSTPSPGTCTPSLPKTLTSFLARLNTAQTHQK